VVGHTAFDHLIRVDTFPERHSSVPIQDHQVYFGGGGANVAAGIARLGQPCTLISAVGPEFSGSEYDLWMKSLGIERELFVVPDRRTPTAYVFTDRQGDQITFFEWGASEYFHRAEVPALEFVHLATADPDFNTRIAQKGKTVSFDPGQDLPWYSRDQLEIILSSLHLLFANRHEMHRLCQMLNRSQEEVIEQVPIVVITMDAGGSMLFTEGEEQMIPIVPVTLADPTGAGDAYRAGFLSAYQRGYLPLTCARIGTVTASFVVERVGCQTNLPDWQHMAERFQAHFGPLEDEEIL
jgi:sugar/nucleoside kinase (ribokinase family)